MLGRPIRLDRTFSRWRRERRELLGFVGLEVVVAASITTQFLGTDLTTASQASLVTVLTPVFTVLFGITFPGERLNRRLLVGIAIATAGTIAALSGE